MVQSITARPTASTFTVDLDMAGTDITSNVSIWMPCRRRVNVVMPPLSKSKQTEFAWFRQDGSGARLL